MSLKPVRRMLVLAIVVGAIGCQSGPRWAWWKRDAAPDDASVIARTAAPPLPSTQTTATDVPAPGVVATPPSSANLAAASAAPATTSPSPTASSVASSTNLASSSGGGYPSATTATTGAPYTSSPGASSAINTPPTAITSAPATAGSGAMASARASAAGPYDPNAYQPLASTAPSATGETVDRYGLTSPSAHGGGPFAAAPFSAADATNPTVASQASTPDRYGVAPPVDSASSSTGTGMPSSAYASTIEPSSSTAGAANPPAGVDRYGLPTSGRYGQPEPMAATPSGASSSTTTGAIAGSVPPVNTSSTVPSTTVKLTSGVGQYRPGGTSSYVANSPNTRVDVASRGEATTPVTPGTAPAQMLPTTAPEATIPGARY